MRVIKDTSMVKDEDCEDDDIIKDKRSKGKDFDSKKFKEGLKSSSGKIKKNIKGEGYGNGPYDTDKVDIPGDPYFLAKYRSFHNHDLDCNYVEHATLVMDEELHKKGSANLLP